VIYVDIACIPAVYRRTQCGQSVTVVYYVPVLSSYTPCTVVNDGHDRYLSTIVSHSVSSISVACFHTSEITEHLGILVLYICSAHAR